VGPASVLRVPALPEAKAAAETALYPAVKRFLEAAGYEAKGEVLGCDVVAVRDEEGPLVVELKRQLNLELVLQAVDRLAIADLVYIAVPAKTPRAGDRRVLKLLRRLGLGLLAISARGRVEVLVEPGPYQPKRNVKRRGRLLAEHRRRIGDPTPGGSTRAPIMTAYRQDALRCAHIIAGATAGASPRELRAAGIEIAAGILQRNVYGWFERVARGRYGLTESGRVALARWPKPREEAA
jgi:hypothetical protein